MSAEDPVEILNRLADAAADNRPIRTLEEVRELIKNPPKRPRSPEMEAAMATIVERFPGDPSIAARLNKAGRRRFLGYASLMSVVAVRMQSPDRIEQGLIALVIEGGKGDWRDDVVVLFQLYHSSVKLGMDAEKTFAKIAFLAEPGRVKEEMTRFPLHPPGSRSLRAFLIEEEITEEGFNYRRL